MRTTKYLLIGGGLASSQAAKMLALKDPGAPVTLVCKEAHLPYDRPPLSKEFLRSEKTKDELFYDPPAFFDERKIDVVLGDPVVAIDTSARTALLGSDASIRFEKALIATGGEPIRLALPGSSLRGIHYLRTIDDVEAIKSDIAPGRRAAVIGAGFIGMELAASLSHLGVRVTVIEALPHIWARFLDAETAGCVRQHCEARGVSFLTGEKVREFTGEERVKSVSMESGREVKCDFVCVGVGIRPNIELARSAGFDVENGFVVDERLQTSHPGVYAAGDAANFIDPVSGKRRRVEHWGHAEYSGQIAGLNMTGAERTYDLLSYAWSDIFDLHIEFAGDEGGHDSVLVRRSPGEGSFTVLYLGQDVLRAYLSINTSSKEFPKLQKLIRRKVPLTRRLGDLANPDFDLGRLLT